MTTTPAPKGQDIEQFRAGFEAWARDEYENLGGEFSGPGDTGWYYWDDETAAAWAGYAQAKLESITEPSSTSTSQGAAPEPDDGKCWTDDLACDHCGQIGWHVCNRGNSGAASGDALDAMVEIKVPYGVWTPCGNWYPNLTLGISADEQHRRNVENGHSAIAASTSKGAKP